MPELQIILIPSLKQVPWGPLLVLKKKSRSVNWIHLKAWSHSLAARPAPSQPVLLSYAERERRPPAPGAWPALSDNGNADLRLRMTSSEWKRRSHQRESHPRAVTWWNLWSRVAPLLSQRLACLQSDVFEGSQGALGGDWLSWTCLLKGGQVTCVWGVGAIRATPDEEENRMGGRSEACRHWCLWENSLTCYSIAYWAGEAQRCPGNLGST